MAASQPARLAHRPTTPPPPPPPAPPPPPSQKPDAFERTPVGLEATQPIQGIPTPAPVTEVVSSSNDINIESLSDDEVDSYLRKIRNFDAIFASDIYLDPRYESMLINTAAHMSRVESYIGHGNFNLMS